VFFKRFVVFITTRPEPEDLRFSLVAVHRGWKMDDAQKAEVMI
jgi:hypothetical protein